MNKAELIEALAQHYDGSRTEATKALNAVVQTITYSAAAGEKVAITGFGVFEKVDRPARMVRNPRTGERKQAEATSVPRFRPGTELKAYVSGERPVPDGGVATPVASTPPARRAPSRSAAGPAPAVAATPAAADVVVPEPVVAEPAVKAPKATKAVKATKAAKPTKAGKDAKPSSKKDAKATSKKDASKKDSKDSKKKGKSGK